MGHSLHPLRLRSHLEIGRRYIVPSLQIHFPASCTTEMARALIKKHLKELDALPSYALHELLLQICINNDLLDQSPSAIQILLLPVFKQLETWRTQRRIKIGLALHLGYDIDIMHAPQDVVEQLLPHIKEVSGSGADLVSLQFNQQIPGYISLLETEELIGALLLFYEYYEKVQLIFFSLIAQVSLPSLPLCLRTPEWISSPLPPQIQKIYHPLVMILGAKLLSIPSIAQMPNCLFCGMGSGMLAKAMTGAPLIVPTLPVPQNLAPLSLSVTDGLYCQVVLPAENRFCEDLLAMTQIVGYFNTIHEEDGYSANRKTRNTLIKSIQDEQPLHLLLKHPAICDLAKKVLAISREKSDILSLFDKIIQTLHDAHNQGAFILDPPELALLHKCHTQIQHEF
ncbi:MAG: hypothetical protein ACRCVN_04575 [Spirochaetia bacterium]